MFIQLFHQGWKLPILNLQLWDHYLLGKNCHIPLLQSLLDVILVTVQLAAGNLNIHRAR